MTSSTPSGVDPCDQTAIRDAATIIVVRDRLGDTPRVLMGQRGSKAAFMPNKVVFPGGAVDPLDHQIQLAQQITAPCRARLSAHAADDLADAICVAAIRELWEETGLFLGVPGSWPASAPTEWNGFVTAGIVPTASQLCFVFRALTPPGRTRRFDARFFLVEADALHGDIDDFSNASDELSNLQWVPLSETRALDLPFITEVVLAEVCASLTQKRPPKSVPFFRNTHETSEFLRLYG